MLNSNFFKKIISKFIGDKPNFLVIEAINNYLQLSLLRVDFGSKNIIVHKIWLKKFKRPATSRLLPGDKNLSVYDTKKDLLNKIGVEDLLKEINKIAKEIPQKLNLEIILNLDFNLATTIYSRIAVTRPNPKEKITEADLDNLLSQGIWKFFEKQRLGATKKMGVSEIDVVLSDVRIQAIKIDGNRVINPIGFPAKSVEIYLNETLAVKDLVRGVKELFPDNKVVLVGEAGVILAHTLFNSFHEKQSLYLANLFSDQTSIYYASGEHLSYVDSFNWGENSLIESLKDALGIDNLIARKILESYEQNKGSDHFIRRLENILFDECRIFANGIESLAPEAGKIFINPYFNLPNQLVSGRLESRFTKKFKIQLLSTDLIMKNFGFTVQFRESAGKLALNGKNLITLISLFSELGSSPKNDKLNNLANRRVRWLTS